MDRLIIRKKGNRNFFHYYKTFEFASSDLKISFDNDKIKLKRENGAPLFLLEGFDLADVSVYDDTVSGNEETFTNVILLQQRLMDLGYIAFGLIEEIMVNNYLKVKSIDSGDVFENISELQIENAEITQNDPNKLIIGFDGGIGQPATILSQVDNNNTTDPIGSQAFLSYLFDSLSASEVITTTTTQEFLKKDDGSVVSNLNFNTTDFIPVAEGDIITRISQSYLVDISSTTPISYYDQSQNFVFSFTNGTVLAEQQFVIPAGISFIRVCGTNAVGVTVKKQVITTDFETEFKTNLIPQYRDQDFTIELKTVANAYNQPFYGNEAGYTVFQPTADGVAPRFYITPNGNPNGVKSKFEMFGTDYIANKTNYNGLNVLVYDDVIHYGSNKGGSGTHQLIVIGGKYLGSALIQTSCRLEFNLDDTIEYKANKHSFDNVLNLKPISEPSSPQEGDVYYDSTTKKLRCYDGIIWNNLFL